MDSSAIVTKITPRNPKIKEVRRVIRVGPWYNKLEFVNVYEWIYGPNSNVETKTKACNQMKIWKMRRGDLTPAAVLSTLIMLEIELKDKSRTLCNDDLKLMYSSSLTRFLNYMSSTVRVKKFKTMYDIASELDLSSFLVDLRHICAHGQTLPNIDILRATTKYCVNWLKNYYWDHEVKYMEDVNASDVRRFGYNQYDQKIKLYLSIYDLIAEVLIQNCSTVDEVKNFSNEKYNILRHFSNKFKCNNLINLQRICIRGLSKLIKQDDILHGGSEMFLDAFMNMKSFFQCAARVNKNKKEIISLLKIHRPLFQELAALMFIENLFYKMMSMASDELETITYKRKGAGFWAYHIMRGYIAFNEFKRVYYFKLYKNSKLKTHLGSINKLAVSKLILKLYQKLEFDTKTTLIFGDTEQQPWSILFERSYILKIVKNVNEYTADVTKLCLDVVLPPFNAKEKLFLTRIIDTFLGHNLSVMDEDMCENEEEIETKNSYDENNIFVRMFEFHDRKKTHDDDDDDNDEDDDDENVPKEIGIWTRLPKNREWSKCPLGRHIKT